MNNVYKLIMVVIVLSGFIVSIAGFKNAIKIKEQQDQIQALSELVEIVKESK